MTDFLLLLKIRLDEMFEFRATFFQKDKAKKFYLILHRLVGVILYALAFFGLYKLADYLAGRSLSGALPIMGYFGGVILTFLVTLLQINETFTGNEDSEFLLSMPFGAATQVFVMFVILYVRNLIFCVLVEVPFYMVYRNNVAEGFGLVAFIVGLLLTSLPVSGIAVLIGMFIILSLAHNPKKNQITSAIFLFAAFVSIIIVFVMADRIFLVSSGAITYDGTTLAEGLVTEISRNFRLGRFYQGGVVNGEIAYIFLFIFMSLIWYMVLLFFHTMAYRTTITALRSPITYGEMSREKVISKLVARNEKTVLLKKEFSQFLRSDRYLLQTGIGVILCIGLPVNFLVLDSNLFMAYRGLVPLVLMACLGLCNTTYCGLSMEGRRFWIINTAPVGKQGMLIAKLKMNLWITIPVAIIAMVIYGLAFKMSALQIIVALIASVLYAIFNGFYAGWIGTKFANFGYESEEMILHCGPTFMLGYLPGVLIPLALIIIIAF